MNILTGIVIAVFLLFMIRGYRRGLIKSLASVISLAASVLLVSFVSPYAADFLREQTPVYPYVMEKCQKTFRVSAEEEVRTDVTERKQGDRASEKTETAKDAENDTFEELQKKAIDELPLPKPLKNLLISSNTEKTYRELAVNSFNDYVPKFMANLIINMISFVLTWIIVASFIWLAVMTLDVIANLPVIHGINQILGLMLGAGQGLILIWIALLVITIFGSTEIGKALTKMIEDSVLLRQLYDTNVILNVLNSIKI